MPTACFRVKCGAVFFIREQLIIKCLQSLRVVWIAVNAAPHNLISACAVSLGHLCAFRNATDANKRKL